jgi:hypothetical protein
LGPFNAGDRQLPLPSLKSRAARDPGGYEMASMSSGNADSAAIRGALKATLAVFLVLALIAGGVAYWWYESWGGYRYGPTDRAVRAARITADATASKDVETIVTQLTPIVGEPTLRAVVDYCYDTGQAWALSDNSIACARVYYLYYPLGSAGPAPEALGTTAWPSHSGSHVGVFVDRAAEADYTKKQRGLPDLAQMEGYRELMFAASSGHSAIVVYDLTYFEG